MLPSHTSGLDERLLQHRSVWGQKETLRLIYRDYYQRLFEACTKRGPLLDIGGGSSHAKHFAPDIVTLDILPFPGIDVVADAHDMPFDDESFCNIVMLDVLHHLERPIDFLKEAARVIQPGGRIAMIEPGITPISWWFYRFLHQEPVILCQDPLELIEHRPNKDPFDSNQAIPTLLFGSARRLALLNKAVPELKVSRVEWLSFVVYPLSGGFKRWCLFPAQFAVSGLKLENLVPRLLRRLIAFRLLVVLERL